MEITIRELRENFGVKAFLYKELQVNKIAQRKIVYHAKDQLSRDLFKKLIMGINCAIYKMMSGSTNTLFKVRNDLLQYKEQRNGPLLIRCFDTFLKFYNNNPEYKFLGPSIPMEVPIAKHTIVEDYFPLILKKDSETEIVIFETQRKADRRYVYMNDPFYSIHTKGFRHEFDNKKSKVILHNLGDGKRIDITKTEASYEKDIILLDKIGMICYNLDNQGRLLNEENKGEKSTTRRTDPSSLWKT